MYNKLTCDEFRRQTQMQREAATASSRDYFKVELEKARDKIVELEKERDELRMKLDPNFGKYAPPHPKHGAN